MYIIKLYDYVTARMKHFHPLSSTFFCRVRTHTTRLLRQTPMWDIPTRRANCEPTIPTFLRQLPPIIQFEITRDRTCNKSSPISQFLLRSRRDVLRSVPARAPSLSVGARMSLCRKRHRKQCRGTDAGGKRAGETGENVFQTGRV